MNKMVLEMPVVSECMAETCAYNVDLNCHARAITIGDSTHPGCDTFLRESHHTHNLKQVAGVGACKTTSCKYNDDFECMTDNIHVGMLGNQINCMTFAARA